jgi:hypothetical protein
MRELNWHATAAEWAFVLEGRVRTTVINPAGHTETNLSAWIAGNPVDVLATNFGRPASLFENFPRNGVFISPNQ